MSTSNSIGPDNKSIRETLDAVLQQNEILQTQIDLQNGQVKSAKRNSAIGLIIAFCALLSSIGILSLNFTKQNTNSNGAETTKVITAIKAECNSIVTQLKTNNSSIKGLKNAQVIDPDKPSKEKKKN